MDTSPGGANLTADGTLDWIIWGTTASGEIASKGATNSKSGGSLFGALGPATTGDIRGGLSSTQQFTYTDGTSPVSETAAVTKGLIFDANLESLNEGVRFTIAGDPTTERVLKIWGSGFDGVGTLTASLAGASNVNLLSQTYGTPTGHTKSPTLFTINYRPDTAGDLLTVQYVLTTNNAGANAHVGITAAAVSAVPEPSAALAGAGACAVMGMLRRRRRGV